jgi:carboxyl-terminal processing protease
VAQSNQPPVDVVDMSLNKAVQLIRGPKGTEVRLTVIPGEDASARNVVSLVRDEIKMEDGEAKAKIIELPGSNGQALRLGVIDLPSFYASFDPGNSRRGAEPKSTTADVARLLIKLKHENVGGVVLDLRRNGGGLLEEAINLTGLFIKQGPVVQVVDSDGSKQVDEDKDPSVLYDGPLIVLTSRFSASASEILAGALQDYGRALIVGDSSTHGKGTVQSVQKLLDVMRPGSYPWTNDPGALKFTIRKFYRVSGASTQLKGVVPDIVLPSLFNHSKEVGESSLDNPLPYDIIASAKYEHVNMVEPYLPELRKRSEARVATDKEFAYIREDIDILKKRQVDKSMSLNEKQRLQEKAEDEARIKARDKERLARKEPQEKVYELTLKLAQQPDLPPPVAKTNAVAKLDPHKLETLSASATNAALAAAKNSDGAVESGLDDLADDEKPSPVDADLVESEHILVDYLSLMPRGSSVVSTTGSTPAVVR